MHTALRTIDRNPTEAQKAAGNYAKGHVRVCGFDITIENPQGSMRCGLGDDGEPWAVKMPAHYGYIKRTIGNDGDQVDVYVGPHHKSPKVFVVDQKDAETGKFDEHKILLGFGSLAQARNTYLRAFSDGKGRDRIGKITEMDVPRFRKLLDEGDLTKPAGVQKFAAGGRVGYADGGALPDAPWATPAADAKPDAPWAKAPAADIGQGNALGIGAMHGLTANFFDEIRGAAAAGNDLFKSSPDEKLTSTLPPGIAHLTGLARLGYEHLTGQPGSATAAYERVRNQERERLKQAKEQYPKTTMVGEIGGALALPGGALMQSATLPGRIGRGAAVGAGYGAASGFGEGEGLADSATRAAIGAPIGVGVGAVAPPLVEGAVQGATALGRPIANAVRGAINPDSEAARRIVTAVDRDIQSDPTAVSRLTPQEWVAARNEGAPVTLGDMGGNLTRRLTDVSAITSPEGATAVNRVLNDRFESQSPRVSDWLTQRFGPSDTGLTREALEDAARRQNRGAYLNTYREGDHPLWSTELQRLVGSPDVVAAMKAAAENGKSRAIVDGMGGFNSSVQVSPTGVLEFTKGKNGVPTYPNLQFWDYTKRELDGAAKRAARAGDDGQAGVLGQLAQKLRSELDTMVPSYAATRAGAARFFGAENALEAGGKYLASNMPLPEARRVLGNMSPAERDLFREGYVQSLTQKIEATGDRRSVLNSIMQSPKHQQQFELVMGPQRTREFEAMMRVEGLMDMTRSAVQGNSWTARRLYDLGLAGGGLETLHGGINQSPGEMTVGALVAALASGGKHIDQRVARRVAEMLVSSDPRVLRQGVQAVARNQNFMNSLRSVDGRIALAGAQEAPRPAIGATQGMLPSHAEEQQGP